MTQEEITMEIRKLRADEIPAAAKILAQGRELLRSRGIPQWQKGGYPGVRELAQDVERGEGYVAEDGGRIIASFAFSTALDPSYKALTSGQWLTDGDMYATVHRLAVSPEARGKGVAGFIYARAAELARQLGAVSIRVDTHPQNLSMQRAMKKAGSVFCGELLLAEGDEAGDPRYGFELLLGDAQSVQSAQPGRTAQAAPTARQ